MKCLSVWTIRLPVRQNYNIFDVHVCIYVGMCVCICMCMYARVHVCMCAYACVCMHVCVNACVCMCVGLLAIE